MTEQQKKDFRVINGNSLDVLLTLDENSVDAIITDPPYELGFMGKKWDSTGIAYNVELWKRALRVLKPGGYLLAFGGSRTYHRIACAIEDAGFEIRDCMMWLYGSGFPKSHNIGLAVDEINGVESKVVGTNTIKKLPTNGIVNYEKEGWRKGREDIKHEIKEAQNEWKGWGTALKPAYEPVVMARKPISEANIAENCLKWGVGGINIDECRIYGENVSCHNAPKGTFAGKVQTMPSFKGKNKLSFGQYEEKAEKIEYVQHEGRFPANLITDGSEEVASGMPNTKSAFNPNNKHETEIHRENADILKYGYAERYETGFNDDGSAMRYFYTAKASKKDRDDGLDRFEAKEKQEFCLKYNNGVERTENKTQKNIHPTVKPVELMQYLVRLVAPKGSVVLDIFNGSGSTGKAVAFENRERDANYKYIGIELTPEYVDISLARIDYALNKYEYDAIKEDEENRKKGQISIFDFNWEEEQ